ncbi:amino acid transporter [Gigaspora margarita]|uniref:Amino acid transporter n=1 Tax=Gigaspora margarita TaxID=4874 RepID=A0A8H4AGX9_GIGMA|nr:amino acid transporter [Gigaspora margarita]
MENDNNVKHRLNMLGGIGYNINRIIGAGIFNPDSIWILVQSPGIALVLFVVCGIISLLGSSIYIELGIRALPKGIGEQKYITDAFPGWRNVGHIFSFVVIFIILPGAIVADSYSSAQYLLYVFRGYFKNDYDYMAVIVSVLILLFITLYHVYSTIISDITNQGLALIKIISLLIISIVGLVRLSGADSTNWRNVFNKSFNAGVYELGAYGNGIIQILFAYEGWNNINYLVEELNEPKAVSLKYSSIISVFISILLYFSINAAFITVIGNNITNNIPIALRFGNELLGRNGEILMSILVAISAFGSVSAKVFIYARIIKYAAETNFIPMKSHWFINYNQTFNTLANQLWAQFVYFLKSRLGDIKEFSIPKQIIMIYILIIILIILASLFPPEYGNYDYLIPYFISWVATILGIIIWYFRNSRCKVNQNDGSEDGQNDEPNGQAYELNIDEIKQIDEILEN